MWPLPVLIMMGDPLFASVRLLASQKCPVLGREDHLS